MKTNSITNNMAQEHDQFYSLLNVCTVISEKISVVISNQNETNIRLDRLEASQEETNMRLNRLEVGQQETNQRLNRLEASNKEASQRLSKLESGQEETNRHLNGLKENQCTTFEMLGDMAAAVSKKILAKEAYKKAKALKKALT